MGKLLPEKQKQTEHEQSRYMTAGTWPAMFKASWQTALRFDRSSLTPFQATRSVLGVGIPLVLGIVTGQVETGVLVASGCLMLGAVGLKDPYQKRARTMLLACVFVTLSALIGGIVGGIGWLPVFIAVGVWGLVAGMFASISQAAQVVAIQACSALIVYTHLLLDPFHALLVAGAVGLGTLFQLLLAIIPSPWTNTLPERSALATIYEKLAEGAVNSSDQQILQIGEALFAGHNTLLSGNTRSEKGQMFARLLEEAEHLRLTLFVLKRQQQYFAQKASVSVLKQASEYLDLLMRESADALCSIARALRSSSNLSEFDTQTRRAEIKRLIGELRELAQSTPDEEEIQQVLPYCTALLGELHITRRLALTWREARQYWPVRIRFPYPRPPHLHLEDIRANIRANLTPRSSAFRHAVRLSVALLLATALYQLFHLSVARGYWIPMTAALVLRSDFTTTFSRGIARLLGTSLGAVLTTLLVVLVTPAPSLLVAFVILASYVMFATLFANYAIFSIGTTMAVVFLLSFVNAPTVTTALDRALDTAIGGVLALLIYALWPTWEQSLAPEYLAKRLEALGSYFYALMQEYADPAATSPRELEKRHKESRLARSNAFGSLQRSLQEPAAHRVDVELAQGLLTASDNISRCVLALHAYLHDYPPHEALPTILDFASIVETSLNTLATAVRTRQPATLPDLQAAFQQLKACIRATQQLQTETYPQGQFLLEEARRIVTYLQTMQQLLTTGSFA